MDKEYLKELEDAGFKVSNKPFSFVTTTNYQPKKEVRTEYEESEDRIIDTLTKVVESKKKGPQ
jgi:hypothetical protein